MAVFHYILILLAAVLLSNLVNRFIPALSVPIVQIVLGIAIALIPFGAFGFEFELEPELFFVLFIAPLVFHSSMAADKRALWAQKKPILGAAVLLVFITVFVAGLFMHTLVPAIPLAAAFALIAALGPTDVVAVSAVGKRVAVPKKIMGVLTGESIINDATGVVCFQFAIAALTTGEFSVAKGFGTFLLLGLGGVAAGLAFTAVKFVLVQWLRGLGIENATLHILIGVLTPFIIYMCAEALGVSGFLAVFAAGIAHSFTRDRFNPETVNLHIAQENVWSVLLFSFDGLVFVMLGTQLPGILRTLGSGDYAISAWQIAGCVLALSALFAAIRFTWWAGAVSKKTYADDERPVGRFKSGLIFALSGARGTVTLAIVLSLPLTLAGGDFPQRELLILIASGVIVVSLLITNFILPLLVGKEGAATAEDAGQTAHAEIMRTVAARLNAAATPETRAATDAVAYSYYTRANRKPGVDRRAHHGDTPEERAFRKQTLMWEKENTLRLLNEGQTTETAAFHYITVLDTRLQMVATKGRPKRFKILLWTLKHFLHFSSGEKVDGAEMLRIGAANGQYVLEKLDGLKRSARGAALDKLAAEYEASSSMMGNRRAIGGERPRADDAQVLAIAVEGFQIERDVIQEMFEAGRVSWEFAREMRGNIATLEARLQGE